MSNQDNSLKPQDDQSLLFTWSKTPTFESKYIEATNDGLVGCLSFLPEHTFNTAKRFWVKSVTTKTGKMSLFKPDAIISLLNETYPVCIDGVNLTYLNLHQSTGTLAINKLINMSEFSSNPVIAEMFHKQKTAQRVEQIKKELWNMFDHSKTATTQVVATDTTQNPDLVEILSYNKKYHFNIKSNQLLYSISRSKIEDDEVKTSIEHLSTPLLPQFQHRDLVKRLVELQQAQDLANPYLNKGWTAQVSDTILDQPQ